MRIGNETYAVIFTFDTLRVIQMAEKDRYDSELACYYLVDIYCSNDTMALSKVKNDAKCI